MVCFTWDPSIIQWGTVGQWIGSIGTSLAFCATYYVIRRDARVRREEQARKVVFYCIEKTPDVERLKAGVNLVKPTYDYTLTNGSSEPIFDVCILYREKDSYHPTSAQAEILLPKDHMETSSPGHRVEASGISRHAAVGTMVSFFRDNSNRHWLRTRRGKLHELSERVIENKGLGFAIEEIRKSGKLDTT